jgi:hypothetical protein
VVISYPSVFHPKTYGWSNPATTFQFKRVVWSHQSVRYCHWQRVRPLPWLENNPLTTDVISWQQKLARACCGPLVGLIPAAYPPASGLFMQAILKTARCFPGTWSQNPILMWLNPEQLKGQPSWVTQEHEHKLRHKDPRPQWQCLTADHLKPGGLKCSLFKFQKGKQSSEWPILLKPIN